MSSWTGKSTSNCLSRGESNRSTYEITYCIQFLLITLHISRNYVFKTKCYCLTLADQELPIRESWPQTLRNPSASASNILNLKAYVIMPKIFKVLDYIKYSIQSSHKKGVCVRESECVCAVKREIVFIYDINMRNIGRIIKILGRIMESITLIWKLIRRIKIIIICIYRSRIQNYDITNNFVIYFLPNYRKSPFYGISIMPK